MTSATTRCVCPSIRGLMAWLAIVTCTVAVGTIAPRPAHAQQNQIDQLVEEASKHYDMLEIGPAQKKLEQAIETANNQGISGTSVAKAYVMYGVVRYGAEKDEESALKAFKEALKQDGSAEIPAVYETPTLKKLMKEAREAVPNAGGGGSQGDQPDPGPRRDVDEFTHEPIASAKAGETLVVEAFVPTNMSVETVNFYFRRYDQDSWNKVPLEATNATRFAAGIKGYKIYTSQIAYYLEAVSPSGETVARSGDDRSPHTITVLGSASFDHEKAKQEALARQKEQQQQQKKQGAGNGGSGDENKKKKKKKKKGGGGKGSSEPTVYLDFNGGTGGGILPKYGDDSKPPPTANPGRELDGGFAPAFGHAVLGFGPLIGDSSSLGLYFRWQFSPSQDFDRIRSQNVSADSSETPYSGFQNGECLGIGLPGDCLLGLKYRYFFPGGGPDLQLFSSVGAGFGRIRHWVRLKERHDSRFCEENNKTIHQSGEGADFCYRTDTVRPGWIHFGVGGGFSYEFNDVFAMLGEAYLEVLVPDTAVNIDINIGPQFRF